MFASRRRPADPATRGQDPTLQKHGSGHPSATCSESVRFDTIMATFLSHQRGGTASEPPPRACPERLRRLPRRHPPAHEIPQLHCDWLSESAPGKPSEPDQASPAQPGPTRPSPAQPSPAQKSHTSTASRSQKAPSNDTKMTTKSFMSMHVRIQPIATEVHENAFSST